MKVVFFNGPSGSGKDTCVKLSYKELKRFSFADKVKKMTANAFGWAEFPEHLKDEVAFPERGPATWRQLVIAFSEEYMKPLYGDDIFGKLLLEEDIKPWLRDPTGPYGPYNIGITDSGFAPEQVPLVSYFDGQNCCIVQLEREGCSFEGDSRGYVHHADTGAAFTWRIKNNGSLAHLNSELNLIRRWL